MTHKVHAHITLDGVPICQRGPHLLSRTITCGHRSLASAHRARRELQKQVTWDRIKVVRGDCPAYDGPIDIEPVTQSDLNLLNRDEFTVALRKAARSDAKLTAGEVSLLLNEAARRLVALGDAFELEHKRADRLQRPAQIRPHRRRVDDLPRLLAATIAAKEFTMTGKQLRKRLEQAALSQRGAARLLEINERTIRRYIAGEQPIPRIVEYALSGYSSRAGTGHEPDGRRKLLTFGRL